MTRALVVAAVCLMAVGCDAQARPVSWWMAHKPELIAKLKWCRDHPGDGGPDCINAETANENLALDRFIELNKASRR